ncbi:MAG TPA: M20/M25/M40 family metallo-hydrolase, partial [Casimicrobiaceae bacterium]|nr:M20/M25/M40 family metallo-hydrolase [Casimicrobiaceae bacterium]
MIAPLRSIATGAALFAAFACALPAQTRGQAPLDPLAAKVRDYRTAHDVAIVREFADLLAIPNLARDSANIQRNARAVIAMLAKRGIAGRLLDGPAGAPPAVYGELRTPGATRTIVLYAHYDGQPVDTTQWITPPWQPVLRDKPADAGGKIIPFPTEPGRIQGEWRLYARSAGDDKAPIEAMLAALDALRAAGVKPSVNLKFFFEGEEEAGSPHVAEILRRNAPLLAADAWLFCDGPVHQSRRQQLVFGVRGVTGAEVTVYGPSHGLHSGHYGNWAPNPVTLLANLIASMRDDDGKILIRSFYDDVAPVTAAEHAAASSAPPVDSALRSEVQLAATEARDAPLVDRIMLPALNLRGIRGGGVGATASNTIPTEATASLDFRLVPRQTPEHVRALVEAHVRSKGYFIVDHDPTRAERMAHARIAKITWEAGYPATRVAMDSPLSRAVI